MSDLGKVLFVSLGDQVAETDMDCDRFTRALISQYTTSSGNRSEIPTGSQPQYATKEES